MEILNRNIQLDEKNKVLKQDKLSLKGSNPKPSKDLLKALKEGEKIIKEVKEGKRHGYNNVNEMMKAILDE